MIKSDGDYLILIKNFNYEILLKQLNTTDNLSQWLCHLNEQSWFDKDLMQQMIFICEKQFNYKFNGKINYE